MADLGAGDDDAGAWVISSDVHARPMVAIRRASLGDELADEDVVGNIDDARNLARARPPGPRASRTPRFRRSDRGVRGAAPPSPTSC
jgi:hypothetical protein